MTHNPPLFFGTSGEGCFESMSYIQAVSRCVNTSCCRNTIESEVRSALLTTTSFNIDSVPLFFFFFFDILTKICFSFSVSAEIFVPVVPRPPILHRPVCKRQRMLHVDHVTWPSAGVTPPPSTLVTDVFLRTLTCQNRSLGDESQTRAGG